MQALPSQIALHPLTTPTGISRILLLSLVCATAGLWAGCSDGSGPCDWCGDGAVGDVGLTDDADSTDATGDAQAGDQGGADDGSTDTPHVVDGSVDAQSDTAVGICTTPVCPTTVEAKGSWFATPSDSEVSDYRSVTFDLTLRNDTNRVLTIEGVQAWATPGVIDVAVSSANLPRSNVAIGAQFQLTFTLDLSALTTCQPGINLRPVSTEKGVLKPDDAPLVTVNQITCQL